MCTTTAWQSFFFKNMIIYELTKQSKSKTYQGVLYKENKNSPMWDVILVSFVKLFVAYEYVCGACMHVYMCAHVGNLSVNVGGFLNCSYFLNWGIIQWFPDSSALGSQAAAVLIWPVQRLWDLKSNLHSCLQGRDVLAEPCPSVCISFHGAVICQFLV